MTWVRRLRNLRHGVLLVAVVVYSVFPIYFMLIKSLKTPQDDVFGSPFIATHPTFENYRELFEPDPELRKYAIGPPVPFLVWVQNTAIVFLGSLGLTLLASLLAAYALGRLQPPGWRWWRRILFASYVIPHTLLFVPLYELVVRLDLDNNLLALVLVYPTLAVPFCVWLLSAYYHHLPRDIEESAYIEGASRLTAFLHIVLPMSRPVLVTAGIFALGTIASDFTLASIFLLNPQNQTVAAGLGATDVSLEQLAAVAGINLAGLPVVIVCAVFARGYVRGLTAAMIEGALNGAWRDSTFVRTSTRRASARRIRRRADAPRVGKGGTHPSGRLGSGTWASRAIPEMSSPGESVSPTCWNPGGPQPSVRAKAWSTSSVITGRPTGSRG